MSSPVLIRKNFWASPLAFAGSLCIHAGLAWLIITNMNSCGQRGDFGSSDVYREVGLYMVDDSAQETEETSQDTPEQLPTVPESLNESLNELPQMTQALPQLPDLPRIGPGPAPGKPSEPSTHHSDTIAKVLSRPPPPSAAGIPGTTKFYGIATSGRTLLYVIDCSGSMNKHNAFRYAKAEMLSSMERLESTHKFQIIFYNDGIIEFKDRRGKPEIHWATALNLSRARTFINGMSVSGATAHYPALMKAISYSPDVIFFLSDAAGTALSAGKLDEIKRKNNGQAAIHCIEFGEGIKPNVENFLHKLARQNEGTYRYRNVTQFGK